METKYNLLQFSKNNLNIFFVGCHFLNDTATLNVINFHFDFIIFILFIVFFSASIKYGFSIDIYYE